MKRESGRSGSWTGRLALSACALVLALVAAETYVRHTYVFSPGVRIGSGATFVPDELVRAIFEADPETIWRMKPNLVSTQDDHFAFRGVLSNSQRVRATEAIPAEKGPRELRILFLGDSITFGWGVRHDETFAALTEAALAERFPELEITAINAGVPAFSLFQGLRLLESEGLAYRPDLVVVAFGTNDFLSWGDAGDVGQLELVRAQRPPAALAWSGLARLVAIASSPAPSDSGAKRPRVELDEFRGLLAAVREASREHGAAMLAIASAYRADLDGSRAPHERDDYQLEMIRFGGSLRLGARPEPALVDGVEALRPLLGDRRPSALLSDHVHPNAVGHAALAEALVDRISPWLGDQVRMGRFAP